MGDLVSLNLLASRARRNHGQGSAGTSTRYWRILLSGYSTIKELAYFASVDGSGTDMCYGSGGTPFSTSVYPGGYAASLAFNGDYTGATVPDCWAPSPSGDLYPVLGFILPTASVLNSLKVCARQGANSSGAPNTFLVQSSLDSTTGLDGTWKNEWMVSGQTGWTSGQIRTFLRTPFPYDIFDARIYGPNTSITNGFRTMVRTGSGFVNSQGLRSCRSHNAGRYSAEFSVNRDPNAWSSSVLVGTGETTSLGAKPLHSWGVQPSRASPATASVFLDGVGYNISPNQNFGSGAKVRFDVDFDAGKLWISVNGLYIVGTTAGATCDPATGTNPTATFTPGTSLWLIADSPFQQTEATINTGQAAFAYAPPAGFGLW